jgi:hypothetical protein
MQKASVFVKGYEVTNNNTGMSLLCYGVTSLEFITAAVSFMIQVLRVARGACICDPTSGVGL